MGGSQSLQWSEFYETAAATLANPDMWWNWFWIAVKIVLFYMAGHLIVRIAGRAIAHVMIERKQHALSPVRIDQRRKQTIGRLVKNVISYVVNFIVLMLILSEIGINLAPLLAGAGVLGLAIGFGAQSLVKDVITGFFIIFEDQFSVGDVIKTGTFQGTVEEIGLRVTRIKSWTGEVHVIPNGSIKEVTNFSLNNSVGIVDVSVAHGTDMEKAIEVIRQAALQVFDQNGNMVKPPEVLGMQQLSSTEIVIRITAECKPLTHVEVARELNVAIKKALETEGMEIPNARLVTL